MSLSPCQLGVASRLANTRIHVQLFDLSNLLAWLT